MQQELMRAVVIMAQLNAGMDVTDAELRELENLCLILKRSSRAQAGQDPELLEATARELPTPPHLRDRTNR